MDLTPPVGRYEQAARLLWRRIYDGEWQPGQTLPGAPQLSRTLGITQSVANRALEWLEARGAVRMAAGRGSEVLARRSYHVTAGVPWSAGGDPPGDAVSAVRLAVEGQSEASPAIGWHDVTPGYGVVVIDLNIEVPDAAYAAAHAGAVLREACRDGWDLAGASVRARPA